MGERSGIMQSLAQTRRQDLRGLRVGLVVRRAGNARVVNELLGLLSQVSFVAEIRLLTVDALGEPLAPERPSLLLAAYLWADHWRNGGDRDLASPAPLAGPEAQALTGGPDDRGLVERLKLDVLVAATDFAGLRSLCDAAPLGLWVVQFGSVRSARLRDTMAHELVRRRTQTWASIWRIGTAGDADRVIASVDLRVEQGYSVTVARQRVLNEGLQLLVLTLFRCAQGHAVDALAAEARLPDDSVSSASPALPGNLELLRWISTPFRRRLQRALTGQSVSPPIWQVALRRLAADDPLRVLKDQHGFRLLQAPAGRAWADPHLVENDGRTWLFVEELQLAPPGPACIVCLEVAADGSVGGRRMCLQRDYHMSFPQVFRWRDEWYMIPETSAAGAVQLYRAQRFPDDWVFVKNLFEGPAVDTIVCLPGGDGQFRFITSVGAQLGQYPHTMVFDADTLTGEWQLHPASPKYSSVRLERNAGAMLRLAGLELRPVQDGGPCYGHALLFRAVQSLDRQGFSERECGRVEPRWTAGAVATHSYACAGGWEALDVLAKPGVSVSQ